MKNSFIHLIDYVTNNSGSGLFLSSFKDDTGKNYFLKNPILDFSLQSEGNIENVFNRAESERQKGRTGIGLIDYEAGYLFEEFPDVKLSKESILLKFMIYEKKNVEEFAYSDIDFAGFRELITTENLSPDLKIIEPFESYSEKIAAIKNYIREGDTYQVNYTTKLFSENKIDIPEFIAKMLFNQSAEFAVIVNLDRKLILSFSPELFFECTENEITVKPMKGTAKRGKNRNDDLKIIKKLKSDSKERAENTMIVDLLRNDIGKISEYNTVNPISFFDIQQLESVFQMTSTIKGKLLETDLLSLFKNLYPCGSITGAPKIRTMQIIEKLEDSRRGIYTGSIGLFDKNSIKFNVAIRTIEIDTINNKLEMGVGSGIVWDSKPEKEYEEVKSKGYFLTRPEPYFEIIESILIEDRKTFLLLYHLERMENAAYYFNFRFDKEKIINAIQKIANECDKNKKFKLRLNLQKWGDFEIRTDEIVLDNYPVDIILGSQSIDSSDKYRFFKTTNRSIYDKGLQKARNNNAFDMIFTNENGNVVESSIANIVIENKGLKFTPAISDGVLNGCYRQLMLDNKQLSEKSISIEDCFSADAMYLVNSVRKEIVVGRVFDEKNKLLKKYDIENRNCQFYRMIVK
ncbi:MAG: bifunctional anthranilate synthase component I family protein/aminotransferase class IV [Melioribacteraceae bacterium]|nr:bifunctional anthranilate synthase component I family protein/aminotransferase class IV [Melioribacteraceae bacterium]MCF8431625.1 bifunctional anthranilate synthase component I family protein/aminotransferase class IV [Melioribacteraceae bacterium]